MTRYTFELGGDHWLFGSVPRQPFTAPDVYDLPAVTEWLPATVPGNVRTDLLALGRIPDPFFGEQYKQSLWVEDVDWWYRRTVEPPAVFGAKSRAFLVFAGIDYLSALFVKGQEMARHESMFSRQIVEITEALRTGTAEIAVRLWGSSVLPRRHLTWRQRAWQKIATPLYRSWVGIYPDRSATLKCQMSFGWDFAPPIRTMGIWDDVYLVVSGPVFIIEAGVTACLKPVPFENDPHPPPFGRLSLRGRGESLQRRGQELLASAPADLILNLTLEANQTCSVEADILISPVNFQGPSHSFHFPLNLPIGRSGHQFHCHLPDAALWQPWDRGQPNLYHVQLTLISSKGQPIDEITVRTGIRAIELQNWQFTVNGQHEFIRGLNWVPADSFPGRLRPEHYTRLLKMARDSGANLLRVWGGGLREKRAFYDLCDELGLLVWQEFPFACMFLGSYPSDPAYLDLVEAECSDIVRQLRHHPSLVLWCGGNEFSRSRNRPLLDTLAAAVQQQDGSRPFIPVSPSLDHGGDAHNWAIWHGYQPIGAYQVETARFLSEFGLQALPHLDTLTAALPNSATGWETHHADVKKLTRYAGLFNDVLRVASSVSPAQHTVTGMQAMPKTFHVSRFTHHASRPTSNLQAKRLISNSQLAQAVALQTAIEHMRRRKGEAGGVCLWQFNEPWPAISWAIVDYFGRPKLAYDRLHMWYNPILVSLKFPVGRRWLAGDIFEAEIWVINDTVDNLPECELQINLDDDAVIHPLGPGTGDRRPESRVIYTQSLDLPANCARSVGNLTYRLTAAPGQLYLTLSRQAEVIAQNLYDLNWFDPSPGRWYHRLRRRLADWVLR